ncbi:MAG TPA: tRNA (adenosine(37)-N6)-dimethylallyltransferase MiaA [Anaerovoracaceae bacterium]|nr:tRNA (adenosine(37)-N6)-dimethylallyltransferase MiaA [Anaerovoracaceae bacterium]
MVNVYVITGPTASGKTKVAIELAKKLGGEIVSCDSMQIYKKMDIGSAKPTEDELNEVKHHLIGVIEPTENFTVAKYQSMALDAIDDIVSRGKIPIVAGGTGLYLNALLFDMDFAARPDNSKRRNELEAMTGETLYEYLKEIDMEATNRIHKNNTKKVIRAIEAAELGNKVKPLNDCKDRCGLYNFKLYALNWDREKLYERINTRVDKLIELGLVEEVRNLFKEGLNCENISMKGIGYKEIIEHIEGGLTLEEAVYLIKRNTRRFAKRQITWFKRYEDMTWIDVDEPMSANDIVEKIL